jgi:hypothetical protein
LYVEANPINFIDPLGLADLNLFPVSGNSGSLFQIEGAGNPSKRRVRNAHADVPAVSKRDACAMRTLRLLLLR